jgi:hypothetical protein
MRGLKAQPIRPKAPADPLADLLRQALQRATDPSMRRWLRQLLEGEQAEDTKKFGGGTS